MNKKILRHYSEFSTYTYPGLYQDKLKGDLPDEIREIGLLIRKNFIHRTMLAALYRRDARGFVMNREPKDKLVLTCRFVAIMTASILKSKGIPSRVRSGNAAYFDMGSRGKVSDDHWINQYWNKKENRWVTIDVDGSLSFNDVFDPYDMPNGKFDFPADAWLNI